MFGLLDNLDDPRKQALIAMGLGLIEGNPKGNRNFGADFSRAGLLGLNAYAGAKDSERKRKADELNTLSQSWKMLKDDDARARTQALFSGQPYQPNPLLLQHEQRLGGLLGTAPPAPTSMGLLGFNRGDALGASVPAQSAQGDAVPQVTPGAQTIGYAESVNGPGFGVPTTPLGAPAAAQRMQQSQQPSIPELLTRAGIDPRMAAHVASTPEGARAVFNKLAEAYGPKNAEGIIYQLSPNGGVQFLGGAVGQDKLPVVPDGRGGMMPAPIPGASQYFANRAGAMERAQQEARAPFTFQSHPVGPGGAAQIMSVEEMRRREGAGAPNVRPQAEAHQIPPQVQAQRDNQRLQILMQEREALAREGRTDPALEQEIAFAQRGVNFAGQRGMSGPNPVEVRATESLNDDFVKNTFRPIMDQARSADSVLARVTALQRNGMLEKSGWGTTQKAYAASVLGALGVKDAEKYATDAQTFNKFMYDANWELLNAAKGPQTNQDAERALKTFTQLGNTPQANRFILDFTSATAKLVKEKAAFVSREAQRNRGDMSGIEQAWYDEGRSIFGYPEMQRWSGKGPSNAPNAGGDPRKGQALQVNQTALYKARQAIKAGKDPEAVRQRLIEQGFSAEGL